MPKPQRPVDVGALAYRYSSQMPAKYALLRGQAEEDVLFIHLQNLPFVQMPAPDSIGQRFIQLIQHLGLSKNAFAQSLDKTATVIQHLVEERNKTGYELLCKVFEVYPNVSKDWLMEGAGPMMKQETRPVEPSYPAAAASVAASPAASVASAPVVAAPLFAATEPVAVVASPAPVPVAAAPVAALVPPVAPPPPAPAPVEVPVAAAPPAPVIAPAPDPAYLTAALQTQYLQHQLALAEQRNQHLLEQQALMQQLVAVLQR